MQELMSRQRYQEITLTEIPAAFPWAQKALLLVAPGHINITYRYLQDIESIVGQEVLNERLNFLRFTDTEEMGFRVFIDVRGQTEVRTSAIQDAGVAAVEASRRICAACGKRVERRDRYCSAHAKQRVLFADDVPPEPMPIKSTGNEPGVFDLIEELLAKAGRDKHLEPEHPETPKLVVFSREDVIRLEKSVEGKDGDTRERIKSVIKKLHETEGTKPLALVPDDWQKKLDQFEADFPNFIEVVESLRDQFALAELGDRSINIPPMLFDGPPGIGKTEVVLSLAALIGSDSLELDMAMAQSSSALAGSEAFWANTREGRLFETLVFGRTANPLVFLDELDKVSGDERHRPDAALYQLLEPRTATGFRDLSIRELKLDASRVLWFAATNNLERVNPAIRSRFVVYNIPAPSANQCMAIAHSIYRRLLARNTWGAAMAPEISDAVASRLAEVPPREMRIKLFQACGRAARHGRREVKVEDIEVAPVTRKLGIGFIREAA